MALIALIVKRSSPGPAIFTHRRLGLGGREFVCYKFRTMVENADKLLLNSPELLTRFDKDFKLKEDPRLTPFGALIRKTSLDELPQLFNVLNGTMSLIGPRPIVPREAGAVWVGGCRAAAFGQARTGGRLAGLRAERYVVRAEDCNGYALYQ